MKFALRDDDLNYFFESKDIENWYKNIWDICPVSMSVVPFIKGNWKINTAMLEKLGPNNMNDKIISEINKDTTIYKVGDNVDLVEYIKKKIEEDKIYLTLHGIEHRNSDSVLPVVFGNFAIGAEFYTDRDLTHQVKRAKTYLKNIFNREISIFTPPQNLLSYLGIKALINNKMAICGGLPSFRKFKTIRLIGGVNFFKYVFFRLKNKTNIYPFPMRKKDFNFITHFRLQPGTNLELLYKQFDEVHRYNGNFVLSTHSYAFDYKMKDTNETMQFELERFINYCKTKDSVNFVSLNKMFT